VTSDSDANGGASKRAVDGSLVIAFWQVIYIRRKCL
jgi:hypothetical protein